MDVRQDVDGTEPVKVALLDVERDHETPALGIVFGDRRGDSNVGVAVLQIPAPEQLPVGVDAVAIVEIIALEEAEDSCFGGLDDVPQAPVAKSLVADEHNALDGGLGPFADLEHEVDAVIGKLDDLRLDPNIVPSGSPVDFEDALDVGLHRCPRERAARFRLHLGVELLVLETLVALERHPIDDGGFNDRDDDLAAGAPDLHVLEQPGVDEGLVGAVDLEVVEALARPEPEVRLDRAGLDPTIALDDDLLGGGAAGGG